VFLRLPGESSGADIEEAEAKLLGLPIYRSLEELFAVCESPAVLTSVL
jgi:hypothetical protein